MLEEISNIEDQITPNIISMAKERNNKISTNEKEHWRQAISWFFLTDNIKTRIRLEIQSKMKINDLFILIISILLIITQYSQHYLYLYYEKDINLNKGTISIFVKAKSTFVIELLRGISSLGTLITFGFIYIHYSMYKYLLIFKQQYELNSSMKSTGLLIPLIIELFIALFHTPPFMNNISISIPTFEENTQYIPVDIDIILSVLSEFRFYFIFKFYFHYSHWGDDRATRICKGVNVSNGILFVLKVELRENPFILLSTLFISSVVIFGINLSICEVSFLYDVPIKFFQDWRNVTNGIWCIFISMTTIGYGDYIPRTVVGRIITIIACLWGLTILSYFIITLGFWIKMTSKESGAFIEIESIIKEKKLKKKSLEMIVNYYRLNRIFLKEKDNSNIIHLYDEISTKKHKGIHNLIDSIKKFRKIRSEVNKSHNEISTEEMMGKINKQINETMNIEINSAKKEINLLLEQLKISKEFQINIHRQIRMLIYMTRNITDIIDEKTKKSQIKDEEDGVGTLSINN